MNTLKDLDLLNCWEKGLNQSLIEKSLYLLAHAYPDTSLEKIALWSIGERDLRLLQLRVQLFGDNLQNTAHCPQCNQKTEWKTPTNALKFQLPANGSSTKLFNVANNTHQVSIRLPNSIDILEISGITGEKAQIDALIKKCIDSSAPLIQSTEALAEDLIIAISKVIEDNDPQADIVMDIQCPACDYQWKMTFDIMQYLWTEIHEWAIRLMQDIALMASHFGWPEKEILNMSRLRRDLYLDFIKG